MLLAGDAGNESAFDTFLDVVENGGGSRGEENNKLESLELANELPCSSSRNRRSCDGRGVVSVVDNDDIRSWA